MFIAHHCNHYRHANQDHPRPWPGGVGHVVYYSEEVFRFQLKPSTQLRTNFANKGEEGTAREKKRQNTRLLEGKQILRSKK